MTTFYRTLTLGLVWGVLVGSIGQSCCTRYRYPSVWQPTELSGQVSTENITYRLTFDEAVGTKSVTRKKRPDGTEEITIQGGGKKPSWFGVFKHK